MAGTRDITLGHGKRRRCAGWRLSGRAWILSLATNMRIFPALVKAWVGVRTPLLGKFQRGNSHKQESIAL